MLFYIKRNRFENSVEIGYILTKKYNVKDISGIRFSLVFWYIFTINSRFSHFKGGLKTYRTVFSKYFELIKTRLKSYDLIGLFFQLSQNLVSL